MTAQSEHMVLHVIANITQKIFALQVPRRQGYANGLLLPFDDANEEGGSKKVIIQRMWNQRELGNSGRPRLHETCFNVTTVCVREPAVDFSSLCL